MQIDMVEELELKIESDMTLEEFTLFLVSKGKLPKMNNPKYFAFNTFGNIRLMYDAKPSRIDEEGFRYYSPSTLMVIYSDYVTNHQQEESANGRQSKNKWAKCPKKENF